MFPGKFFKCPDPRKNVELNFSITVYWSLILIVNFKEWSKSVGWGGPGQRGGWVVKGGSCNFQLPMGVGHSTF